MFSADNNKLRGCVVGIFGFIIFIVVLKIVGNALSYSNSTYPNEVDMTDTGFAQKQISITAVQRIYIANSSALTFSLCLGRDQLCNQNAISPHYLTGFGVTIRPDHMHYMSFDPGTYEITIRKMPEQTFAFMNLLVQVGRDPSSTPANTNYGSFGGGGGANGKGSSDVGINSSIDTSDGDMNSRVGQDGGNGGGGAGGGVSGGDEGGSSAGGVNGGDGGSSGGGASGGDESGGSGGGASGGDGGGE